MSKSQKAGGGGGDKPQSQSQQRPPAVDKTGASQHKAEPAKGGSKSKTDGGGDERLPAAVRALLPEGMPRPLGCPKAAAHLAYLDQIRAVRSAASDTADQAALDEYTLTTAGGVQLYHVDVERTGARQLQLSAVDQLRRHVFDADCSTGGLLGATRVTVTSGESAVATVTSGRLRRSYTLSDGDGEPALRLKGPPALATCFGVGPVVFDVLSADGGHLVGKVFKRWLDADEPAPFAAAGGGATEAEACADEVAVHVPLDMAVWCKLALAAFAVYVDAAHFAPR